MKLRTYWMSFKNRLKKTEDRISGLEDRSIEKIQIKHIKRKNKMKRRKKNI